MHSCTVSVMTTGLLVWTLRCAMVTKLHLAIFTSPSVERCLLTLMELVTRLVCVKQALMEMGIHSDTTWGNLTLSSHNFSKVSLHRVSYYRKDSCSKLNMQAIIKWPVHIIILLWSHTVYMPLANEHELNNECKLLVIPFSSVDKKLWL